MLRLSCVLRAEGCFYHKLGIPPTATTAEIKKAFRDRAKVSHPDTATSKHGAGTAFRDLVDAYRVLRDPQKRAKYDREVASRVERPEQWPRGHAMNCSEEFRANLYNFTPGAGRPEANTVSRGLGNEAVVVGAVLLGGVWFMFPSSSSERSGRYHERDPYPMRPPAASKPSASSPSGATKAKAISRVSPEQSVSSIAPVAAAEKQAAAAAAEGVGDELVRAYYNPFAEKWQRLPQGYEPPGAMDLTSWHKKRTDPVEWSRLFAEGKLSEIIPRGGLKVRFRPAWDTYEPILVKDPHTGKTVEASGPLPPRGEQTVCEVQF